jgi:hypothetical protein
VGTMNRGVLKVLLPILLLAGPGTSAPPLSH